MAEYRRPYLNPGEDRRPTLTWPRQIPIEGEPADVAQVVADYADWLAQSHVPKLYIHVEPGALDQGRAREFCQMAKPEGSDGEEFTVQKTARLRSDGAGRLVRGLRGGLGQ
jgi:haloalkane dehalogenase